MGKESCYSVKGKKLWLWLILREKVVQKKKRIKEKPLYTLLKVWFGDMMNVKCQNILYSNDVIYYPFIII